MIYFAPMGGESKPALSALSGLKHNKYLEATFLEWPFYLKSPTIISDFRFMNIRNWCLGIHSLHSFSLAQGASDLWTNITVPIFGYDRVMRDRKYRWVILRI